MKDIDAIHLSPLRLSSRAEPVDSCRVMTKKGDTFSFSPTVLSDKDGYNDSDQQNDSQQAGGRDEEEGKCLKNSSFDYSSLPPEVIAHLAAFIEDGTSFLCIAFTVCHKDSEFPSSTMTSQSCICLPARLYR